MIKKVSHVAASTNNAEEFIESILKAVGMLQDLGLAVEIQYGSTVDEYNALIIGRMP